MPYTYTEIEEFLSQDDYLSRFMDLYSLKEFLIGGIYANDNHLFENLNLKLELTESGKRLAAKIQEEFKEEISREAIELAVFIDFYSEELHIDIAKTDIAALEKVVSDKIKDRDVLFPYVFGRTLYDKYFSDFDLQNEDLDFEETISLLENTPQGVFQIHKYISGPAGLIKTSFPRAIEPQFHLKLWHCSDPSCERFHSAKLNDSDENFLMILLSKISQIQAESDFSDFNAFYRNYLFTDYDYFNDQVLTDVYNLIANNFVEGELKLILRELIDNGSFRKQVEGDIRFRKKAEDIVKDLNYAECLQLILLCDDKELVYYLEKLINEDKINIPTTEIRSTDTKTSETRIEFGGYRLYYECNQLGVRIESPMDIASLRLKRLLNNVYSESHLKSTLQWKLRTIDAGDSLDEKIEKYILEENLQKIIQETILIGPVQLNKATSLLAGFFESPDDVEKEKALINKILWKMGFDIPIYPNHLNKFWGFLRRFQDSVSSSMRYNESEKEIIRGSAVNLFVSLEEILTHALSFITWALLSDHYIDTKFRYVYEDAREFMTKQLDGFEYTEGEKLIFEGGKATLFPLVTGFNVLTSICDTLLENAEANQKPKSQIPSFHENDTLASFIFLHKQMVLDLKLSDYTRLKEKLLVIASEFNKFNVISIRNRLQHIRDDFPIQEEILAACNAISNVVSMIENVGIYPNVYIFNGLTLDQHKRKKNNFKDYKGQNIVLSPTLEFDNTFQPDYYSPQIIMSTLKLGETSHPLRFVYQEKSYYQQYWKGFPRKKKIENQPLENSNECSTPNGEGGS